MVAWSPAARSPNNDVVDFARLNARTLDGGGGGRRGWRRRGVECAAGAANGVGAVETMTASRTDMEIS
jgi:hypothetical protein